MNVFLIKGNDKPFKFNENATTYQDTTKETTEKTLTTTNYETNTESSIQTTNPTTISEIFQTTISSTKAQFLQVLSFLVKNSIALYVKRDEIKTALSKPDSERTDTERIIVQNLTITITEQVRKTKNPSNDYEIEFSL